MNLVKLIVNSGLSQRSGFKIKVRQPLSSLDVEMTQQLDSSLLDVIADEVNVKEIRLGAIVTSDEGNGVVELFQLKDGSIVRVHLDVRITPELKLEGEAREIIRAIQEGRKKAGFNVEDRIILGYTGMEDVFANAELQDLIAREVLAKDVQKDDPKDAEYTESVDIEGKKFSFSLRRI